ncbi:hypothetical protein VE03_02245 [Pseudogymnoascus sp. 23342-1-I1]|nr:hypothetical protein VE03_02245 [Pseudogymnoascus sp. 23342-1-I1]
MEVGWMGEAEHPLTGRPLMVMPGSHARQGKEGPALARRGGETHVAALGGYSAMRVSVAVATAAATAVAAEEL